MRRNVPYYTGRFIRLLKRERGWNDGARLEHGGNIQRFSLPHPTTQLLIIEDFISGACHPPSQIRNAKRCKGCVREGGRMILCLEGKDALRTFYELLFSPLPHSPQPSEKLFEAPLSENST